MGYVGQPPDSGYPDAPRTLYTRSGEPLRVARIPRGLLRRGDMVVGLVDINHLQAPGRIRGAWEVREVSSISTHSGGGICRGPRTDVYFVDLAHHPWQYARDYDPVYLLIG